MPPKVIEFRQLIQILTMFMIVQFLGLLLATQVFNGATYQELTGAQVMFDLTARADKNNPEVIYNDVRKLRAKTS